MIGIFRKLPLYSNVTRCTRYSVIRLCSNKSDDDQFPWNVTKMRKQPNTSSKSTSFVPKKVSNTIYSISAEENNASVLMLLGSLPSNAEFIKVKTLKDFYNGICGKYLITKSVINHPMFDTLREATKILLPKLHSNEVTKIYIALIPSKCVMNDMLSEYVIEALIDKCTLLNFGQILVLDFLIRKYYSKKEFNKSQNILLSKLQTMFLSKIDDALDGLDDLKKIMNILAYCENNAEIIPQKVVNTLTTALLLAEDDEFSVQHLFSIIIFLSNFGKLDEHVAKLLKKAVYLWCQSTVEPHNVINLFKTLAYKNATMDSDMFKNTDFIRCCVNIVIQNNDRNQLFTLQNSFNKVQIVSKNLIDHLSQYFQSKESVRQLTISEYIVMCRACRTAGYKPDNWQSHIVNALKSFNFSIYLPVLENFNWAKFALTLYDLGYCDTQLIENILQTNYIHKNCDAAQLDELEAIFDNRLVELFKQHKNNIINNQSQSNIDRSEYYEIWDDKEYDNSFDAAHLSPVYNDLKYMFGANFVWYNLQIDSNLKIPFVLKIDGKTGEFLPIYEKPTLQLPKERLIAIIVVGDDEKSFKMEDARVQSNNLEQKGISSIIIQQNKWNTLKKYEKSLEFYTKVTDVMGIYDR